MQWSKKTGNIGVVGQVGLLVAGLLIAGLAIDIFAQGDIFWPAYFAMTFFYGLIFFIAIWSVRRDRTDHLLANRSMPLWLAVFTMSATWVGGGFINGSAEYTYSAGLVWVQAPWGYALSLVLGGLFFAKPMRTRGYTTMLDPLEERFGKKLNILYYIPALTGDLFWTSAILVALGTTFGTILGIDASASILLSAMVVIVYTSIGGLKSVAVTDVVQLIILIAGLSLVVMVLFSGGYSLSNVWQQYQSEMGEAASFIPSKGFLGSSWASWWDGALLLMLGGIPWQVYFQRVLASKDARTAVRLSLLAGVVCLLAAVPAILIGMVASVTDWQGLGFAAPPDASYTLPHVIRYLTNPLVATVGLGAIAAAVMSSADSSILSASTLTAWNIWPGGREKERADLTRLMRRCIWIVGIATLLIAIKVQSIYILWVLCSDLVYCLLFPALVMALFDPKANKYGAIAGFAVSLFLRIGGGEPLLGLPTLLPYPMSDGMITIPFRTIAMLLGLLTIFTVSRLWPRD